MNLERKAIDLAREMKGVSIHMLIRKFKLSLDEAEILAMKTNADYLRMQENKKRTRFGAAHNRAPKVKLRNMRKIPKLNMMQNV